MSRRIPVSAATREYDRIMARWPHLAAALVDTAADPACISLARPTVRDGALEGVDALAYALMTDEDLINPEEVVWLSRWRSCRHVYRIDQEVRARIMDQDVDEGMPTDALRRMPYPVMFVECPIETFRGDKSVIRDGFVAWTDCKLSDSGSDSLYIEYLGGGAKRALMPVDLSMGTLGEVIDDLYSADEEMRRSVEYGDKLRLTARDNSSRQLAQALNLLLYVITSEDDAEVTYRPPSGQRGQRPGRRTNPETHHLMGARMGRAIGAARTVALGGPRGDGSRTVSPHVRRAHWQHYWTGKRKGRDDGRFGDELIVRWVPPVFVNGDGETIEVVHES